MIDPDRVGQMVCMPGEQVRMELGFRWDAVPQAVGANFRKFVGSRYSARNIGKQIALEGKETNRVAARGAERSWPDHEIPRFVMVETWEARERVHKITAHPGLDGIYVVPNQKNS